ncbi:MAG: sulfatase-like hydrolase/transferase, partial [Phycisphaerales bacterium]|nr:sulfatase-like hydrolase/transferase [Phycisphaerales bacterium]
MIRRLVLTLLALVVPHAFAGPPNVVLIIGDDQSWTDYGFMGHPHIETPAIDRLAREGRVFPQARVPSSLCSPSLASIITGRYPFEHLITGNEPPRPDGRGRDTDDYRNDVATMIGFIDRSPTLPRLLGDAGYRSFQSGKWWLGSFERGGFTDGMTHGDPARGGRHGDEGLAIGREGLQPIF